MKKILLSLAIVATFATASFAQLSGGVRAGLNLSNQKVEFDGDSESGDMKAGLQFGLYLVGNLSDKIAIQPELVYSSFGAVDPDDSDFKSSLGYISIPVLLRYNVNEMFNLHVGPQFGILASAKYKGPDDSVDAKDEYNGLDVGLAIGAGLDFGKVNAGLRYYAGLSNVADVPDGVDVTAKNSAIQIVVGYRLFGGE